MNLFLSSTAELFAEHRRTTSPRKKLKIAAELQRRHDELYQRPEHPQTWWRWESYAVEQGGQLYLSGGHWTRIFRFDFAVMLP